MADDARKMLRRLGARVRALRVERSLTQAALGERCGLSVQYVGQVERGVRNPTLTTLARIARRGFGVSLSALFFQVDGVLARARRLDDVLAGRARDEQERVLRAVAILLGEGGE